MFAVVLVVGATSVEAAPARLRPSPSFNGTVYAVAYRGDTVYVGGSFTSATASGRTVARSRLAAFNAATGQLLSWAPPVNGTVKALAVSGGAVYLAGDFSAIAGRRRDGLAEVSTSGVVGSFDHVVSGEAAALSARGGRLYVGGRFSRVDGQPRANLAAFALAGGSLDHSWRPATDSRVEVVRATASRVYVGGDFHRVNGSRGALRLAAVSATSGSLIPAFHPRTPAVVYAVTVDSHGGVYAATGGAGGRAIAYTPSGAIRWTHLFNGDAHAIATIGGVTYVGGHFDTACARPSTITQLGCLGGRISRVKLAALDSRGHLTTWNPHANGVVGVRALATNGRQIAAAGEFSLVSGTHRGNYACFG
jgi:hypothetical protein